MELVEYQLMDALEQEFWWYRGLHAVIVERLLQLNLPAQAKVLDAGCGTGGMLVHWQHVAPHYAYAGLEWHSEAAAMAEKKAQECPNQHPVTGSQQEWRRLVAYHMPRLAVEGSACGKNSQSADHRVVKEIGRGIRSV